MQLRRLLMFLLVMTTGTCSEKDSDEEAEVADAEPAPPQPVFKLTKDWQTVPPGAALPRGVHVRMNLHTKEVQAKEYEPEERAKTDLLAVDPVSSESGANEENEESLSEVGFEEALKSLTTAEEANRKVHVGKTRTYEQLKEDLGEGKEGFKSSSEVMLHMIRRFDTTELPEDESIAILSDLEHMCHYYIEAHEFVRMGGLTHVALTSLNHTSARIRTAAARLLGAAMQSNPTVQIRGLESGADRMLLFTLSKEENSDAISALVFALSAMMRKFPLAQGNVVRNGGLAVLSSVFAASKEPREKVRVKIATMLADLVAEKNAADLKDEERLRQYESVALEAKLREEGWCELLALPLPRISSYTSVEHDYIEKVLSMMSVLADLCASKFRKYVPELETLQKMYYEMSLKDEDDGYFISLATLAHNVLAKLESNTPKDEL